MYVCVVCVCVCVCVCVFVFILRQDLGFQLWMQNWSVWLYRSNLMEEVIRNPESISGNTLSLSTSWNGWKDKNDVSVKCFNIANWIVLH